MSENKILEAVNSLDANNDNHWTADGQPRLETVRFAASDQNISRADVETAAPGYNRQAARERLQGEGAQGNGAGTEGTQTTPPAPPAPPVPMVPAQQADSATPPTTPSEESLRGTDNDTLREQASEPGPNNLNADGGASNGPSVPDEVQAAAASGAAQPGTAPEIAFGATTLGFNATATPESNAFDAAISTAHSPTTPPELGGNYTREGSAPGGLTADSQPAEFGAVTATGEAQLHPLENGRPGDPDALPALEKKLEAAAAKSARLKGQYDDIGAQLAESTLLEAQLRDRIASATPRDGVMPAIQNYFAQQDAANEQLIAARNALAESGIDLGQLNKVAGLAPIDKAAADANKA